MKTKTAYQRLIDFIVVLVVVLLREFISCQIFRYNRALVVNLDQYYSVLIISVNLYYLRLVCDITQGISGKKKFFDAS